jgi:hypothetical protein
VRSMIREACSPPPLTGDASRAPVAATDPTK